MSVDSVVSGAFSRRVAPIEGLAASATALSLACRDMAGRFTSGGRLLVFGNGSGATDAQHVAVEFVHPVIVGKRALPALSLVSDAATLMGVANRSGLDGVYAPVNDLAVSGARPVALSTALVLEEGLAAGVLELEITAMAAAAQAAEVCVVAGDTKVVERGKCDQLYIVTTGIGVLEEGEDLSPQRVCFGDKVLVSGTVGDHGIAILLARGELDLEADVRSDTQPLWALASALMLACGPGLHCMRDATRGGVATVLNEIALAAEVGVVLEESRVPVRPEVAGAGELLGIDPLYVANEGKLIAFVAAEHADAALAAMRALPSGRDAAIVGSVREEPPGRVLGRTAFGGHRLIDMLVGDPLPRIC